MGALFSIIFIALVFLINAFYIPMIFPQSELIAQFQEYEKVKHNISVLVIGDSHPKQGIDRSYFPEAFIFVIEGGKHEEISVSYSFYFIYCKPFFSGRKRAAPHDHRRRAQHGKHWKCAIIAGRAVGFLLSVRT